jgi:Flp pilus assembly pilin Flp
MQSKSRKPWSKLFRFLRQTKGQDLVEYALVASLIAFAVTASMKSLATRINNSFVSVATTLSTYTS